MVNQLELHPFYQREEELAILREYGIVPQAWAPFAEGMNGMFTNPVLKGIAERHGKTVAQVILHWNVQRGVGIIPKSVHRNRMEENPPGTRLPSAPCWCCGGSRGTFIKCFLSCGAGSA